MSGFEGLFSGLDPTPHKIAVWQKGAPIHGYDASVWRYDQYGYLIRYGDYGDRSSKFGWEIDHITPVALGGNDAIENLRPLNWQANAGLGGLLGALLGNGSR